MPALWSTSTLPELPDNPNGDPLPKYSGDRFNTSWTLPLNDPTAVTMGDVDLIARGLPDFLRDLGTDQMSAADLLALLRSWDPDIAANLDGADADVLLQALRDYLDPDGDGQVVVFVWATQEQRGTVGFFAERSDGGVWSAVNTEMLPALIAAPMGAQYWLVDPGVQLGDDAQYRLIEVEATGKYQQVRTVRPKSRSALGAERGAGIQPASECSQQTADASRRHRGSLIATTLQRRRASSGAPAPRPFCYAHPVSLDDLPHAASDAPLERRDDQYAAPAP